MNVGRTEGQRPPARARASRWRVVLFSLVPALVVFGGAEIALRLAGFEYYRVPRHLQFGENVGADLERDVAVPDPVLFWRPRVSDRTRGALLRRRHVHPELREQTGALDRSPGTLRVVAMGDSCTFFGSPPYPQQLERELGAAGVEARVFSASVAGYTSYQGRRWFDAEVAAYEPDWVSVYYGWNDHWLAMSRTDRELGEDATAGGSSVLDELGDRIRLVQAARYLKTRLVAPPRGERPLRVPLDDYRDNLEYLCRRAREIGAHPILITAPSDLDTLDLTRLTATGYAAPGADVVRLHELYNEVTREVARDCGAALVDFAADGATARGLVSDDGIHLTEAGTHWLARRLAAVIVGSDDPS